jgi:hypothetical protein
MMVTYTKERGGALQGREQGHNHDTEHS